MVNRDDGPVASLGLVELVGEGPGGSLYLTSIVLWSRRFDVFFTIAWRGPRSPNSRDSRPIGRSFLVRDSARVYDIHSSGLAGGQDQSFGRLHLSPSLPSGVARLEFQVESVEWQLTGAKSIDVSRLWD